MENIALQFEYEESGDQKFISRIKNASEINKGEFKFFRKNLKVKFSVVVGEIFT